MSPSQLRQLADRLMDCLECSDNDIDLAASELLNYATLLEDLGNSEIEEANRSLLEVEE